MTTHLNKAPARYRPLAFGVTQVELRAGDNGNQYLQAAQALGEYATRITDRFLHWTTAAPERTFLARRTRQADGSGGDWQHLSYSQALRSARAIAQGLIDRGLSAERPVVILSENSLEHAQLALGCLLAGVPYSPVSPAYALAATDFAKLRHVIDTLTPGLVFAPDAARYGKAIEATVSPDVEVVLQTGAFESRAVTAFDALLVTAPTAQVDAAIAATSADTIVKFLFTSGSTKLPKAVINTHRCGAPTSSRCASRCRC